MREISVVKRLRRMWGAALLGSAFLALCLLSGGCLALRCERRNKPVAPADQIKTHKDDNEMYYSRFLDFHDFSLEIGVVNGPSRWEMGFLFWVLPLQYSLGGDDRPFYVRVQFEPKSESVTFDPWQIYFLGLGTNVVRIGPAEVWQDRHLLGTNASTTLLITNDTDFSLKFSPWAEMFPIRAAYQLDLHPDRDSPFQLSIEGIRVSGRSVVFPPLTYEPTAHIRPEFRLPY